MQRIVYKLKTVREQHHFSSKQYIQANGIDVWNECFKFSFELSLLFSQTHLAYQRLPHFGSSNIPSNTQNTYRHNAKELRHPSWLKLTIRHKMSKKCSYFKLQRSGVRCFAQSDVCPVRDVLSSSVDETQHVQYM